jgi:hypothetical protein
MNDWQPPRLIRYCYCTGAPLDQLKLGSHMTIHNLVGKVIFAITDPWPVDGVHVLDCLVVEACVIQVLRPFVLAAVEHHCVLYANFKWPK